MSNQSEGICLPGEYALLHGFLVCIVLAVRIAPADTGPLCGLVEAPTEVLVSSRPRGWPSLLLYCMLARFNMHGDLWLPVVEH